MKRSLLFLFVLAASACETFNAPPEPVIVGLDQGILGDDSKKPVVIDFGESVQEQSVNVRVVPFVADGEGRLADKDNDEATDIDATAFFVRDPSFTQDIGGTSRFSKDGSLFTIEQAGPFPIGPRLAVLVEAGLSDKKGNKTKAQRILPFGYQVTLDCPDPSADFREGAYFFLADVADPLPVQVKLLARIRKDSKSGSFIGQFSAAVRAKNAGKCKPGCDDTEVCRTLPEVACVPPSEKATSVDEFPDFEPNTAPPRGYSFTGTGCVIDQAGGSVVFTNFPIDVEVASPPVTLRNLRLNASFETVGKQFVASGSFSADSVIIGGIPSDGGASGELSVRFLSEEEAPKNIPEPPKGDFE